MVFIAWQSNLIMAEKFIAPKMLLYIGGTLIVIGALFTLVFGGIGAMMSMMFRAGVFIGTLGVIGLLLGALVIVTANELGKKKANSEMWLVIALVASIISMVDGGGFIIGAVLVFIGSIIGLIELDMRR
jgi:asparagine N-glycosylation enzyme membrane subunit Stt3